MHGQLLHNGFRLKDPPFMLPDSQLLSDLSFFNSAISELFLAVALSAARRALSGSLLLLKVSSLVASIVMVNYLDK